MKKPILIEFIIWTIILTIIFNVCIFTYSKIFVEPNIYTIQFRDIDGITKGSPVRFMGINVGYVRKLKPKDKYVDVQIIITQKDMKIPNGTAARVEFYGLGGSKSIELMPPDGSCNVGILTGDTIRLYDVVYEAIGVVEVVEIIERYVESINEKTVQKFLYEMKSLRDDKLKSADDDMKNFKGNISEKFNDIKIKQDVVIDKIKGVNNNVEKLNQFINK